MNNTIRYTMVVRLKHTLQPLFFSVVNILTGAIIGDIGGSRFEFNNHKSKDFTFFTDRCFFTDDTVMTLAVADALNQYKSITDC